MKGLAALPVEEKKTRGAAINVAKQAIEAALQRSAARRWPMRELAGAAARPRRSTSRCPAASAAPAACTRCRATMERIEAIFGSMGFDVADGPEIETDWHSFTSLNNPENHPARSMQDTFYVDMKDDDGRWLTCARTPARCRCAMRTRTSTKYARPASRCPRSASSRPAAPTASTATPPIRRCSTSAKACGSART